MSDIPSSSHGHIAWVDLTVPNAAEVRDFYAALFGWKPDPVDMGDYSDFNMLDPASGKPVVGVCNKQGPNTGVPAQWMIYFTVPDLTASIETVERLGGSVIDGPRAGFCMIRDPGGAVCALFETKPE